VTAKRVVLTAQARRDIREATTWYRKEGGKQLARRWVAAVEDALRHIGTHPKTGSARYAVQLKMDDLRFWPVSGFPYWVFYIECEQHIDAGRVLHGKRDIPAWMAPADKN
jgi:toxin ParE1/3/4